MSQDEIAVMDGSKCILQLRGVRPFLSNKFDITKHKQYHCCLTMTLTLLTNEKDHLYQEARRLRTEVQEAETVKRCLEQVQLEPPKEQTRQQAVG